MLQKPRTYEAGSQKAAKLSKYEAGSQKCCKNLSKYEAGAHPPYHGEAANTKIAQTWGLIHLNQQFSPIP